MADSLTGTNHCGSGYVLASCDGIKITIRGKGCHGAQPHNGIDPVNVASHLHLALQGLIARETPPDQTAVLTIGQILAGTAATIIPETAVMLGTLRTYRPILRSKMRTRLAEMTGLIAAAFGARAEIETLSEVPPLSVNPEMMAECRSFVRELAPDLDYDDLNRSTGSDDFAHVAERVPSVFFMIGAAPDQEARQFANYSPQVIFDESALPLGTAIFAQCAERWLNRRKPLALAAPKGDRGG
jgi:amidohydrolase